MLFRSKELDINLNKINVLIGSNGSGKSNFLSFFEFLNRLNTAQAIAAEANANFTNENIRTIEGQLQLWTKQAENWEEQRENVKKQIEEQVKQWEKENMFEGKKVNLEQTRTIADIILRSLDSVQKIGLIVGTAVK